MKEYIKSSHDRCNKMGVDLSRIYSSKIISGNELSVKLKDNLELMETASPFIERLYNFVKGSNFFAMLTDKDGCILKVIGDQEITQEAYDLKMVPGAYMSEEHIGTNAMGTALAEGIPVQVSGEEHFVQAYHRWTCSGAPIKDSAGNIIGSIDLTGNKSQVHSHTLGMVVAAADSIEYMLGLELTNKRLHVAKKYIETIMDSIEAGIFTIGPKGYMKTLNKKAATMLGYNNTEIIGRHVIDFIEGWDKIKIGLAPEKPYVEEEAFINTSTGRKHYTLSIYFILDEEDLTQGYVCIIREIQLVRKIANKIMGLQAYYTFNNIIGKDQELLKLVEYCRQIANSPSTVLITGESGTGKEVFAQAIHNASNRCEEPFIAINCGALPPNLIETELFGYEEGAFTGAKRGGKPGKFELADGGTLFLDEIGEMPIDMQTNFLRVLEEGMVCRVGGNKSIKINVRIIAATNKDLQDEVNQHKFRKDLFYRLNVLPVHLPPLRERKEDIPLLVEHFIETKASKLKREPIKLSQEQLSKLINYHWPGNIRELENVIESIVNAPNVKQFNFESKSVHSDDFSYAFSTEESEKLADIEKLHITRVLKKYHGNISFTAKALGIARNTLYRKIEEFAIDVPKEDSALF